jgi:hypothetical protein
VSLSFEGKENTFDYLIFILLGGAMAVYGLLAKTFVESSKNHILTPSNKLEKYVPRWYHRLLLTALGLTSALFGVFALFRH